MIKLICDQGHADHIDLQVTTNGKLFIPKFNEYLKQFERVIISLSIDDITDRFEYTIAIRKSFQVMIGTTKIQL